MTSYTFDCECPRCGAKTIIHAGKYDTVEPDQCSVCKERGEAVNLKIVTVTVNEGDPEWVHDEGE